MDAQSYVVNVDGAVVRDGRYLLVERAASEDHAAGTLGLPGGTVEPTDESGVGSGGHGDGSGERGRGTSGMDLIQRTAVRELREEVGLAVGHVEYVASAAFTADDGTPCLTVVTLCEDVRGEASPQEPDEVAAVHWLDPEAVVERPDVPAFTERDVRRVERHRTGRPRGR
jgi:8-oxo-dGTP diphosphatase